MTETGGRKVDAQLAADSAGSEQERIAAIAAQANSRHAHHEAGHAVAAVYRGGTLVEVVLATTDWTRITDEDETPGWTKHITDPTHHPFVTYAGPWAEAMWTVENDSSEDDFDDLLEYAWDENSDGDAAKYEGVVDQLEQLAGILGLKPFGRDWEFFWRDELDTLWPVISEIAAVLLRGETLSHELVAASIARQLEEPAI